MVKKVKIKRKNDTTQIKENIDSILCIVLKETKGSNWIWLDDTKDRFSVDGHTYFPIDEGTYMKGYTRFMVFLEGISTPFHHGYIERETVTREIVDRDTQETKTIQVDKIKGLKFDSKLIDMLLNRNLADIFTRAHLDLPNLILIILLIVNILLGVGNLGMWFA